MKSLGAEQRPAVDMVLSRAHYDYPVTRTAVILITLIAMVISLMSG